MQGAADRARDADERFESRQPLANGRRDRVPELGAAAGDELPAGDFDPPKRRGTQSHDHTGHAFIADQQVRSAAQHPRRQAHLVTAPHEGRQFFDAGRFSEILRRPPQAQPGIGRQRLVFANDMLEARWNGHAAILPPAGQAVSIAILSRHHAPRDAIPHAEREDYDGTSLIRRPN